MIRIAIILLTIFNRSLSIKISFDAGEGILDQEMIDKYPGVECLNENSLRLSGLELFKIPEGMVRSNSIKSISLDENKIINIPVDAFQYTPNLECLNLAHNSISEEEFKLVHNNLKTLIIDFQHNRQVFDIESNDYPTYNPIVQTRLPNLETLSWKGYIKNDFENSFWKSLPIVSNVYLSDSDFATIAENMTKYIPHLRSIHLERNKIRNLVLNDFGNLENLYLDENPLENIWINPIHQNLKLISLSRCNLQNPLELHVPSLMSLDLSGNTIRDELMTAFTGTPFLEILSLSNNQLLTVPNLLNLNYLKELSLSYNFISEIVNPMLPISIKTLNLRGNRIHNIHGIEFSQLKSLEKLDLSENKLTSLTADWSDNFKKLRILNLKSNMFLTIDNMKIASLQNLEKLYVGGNLFTYIEGDQITYIPGNCTVHVV